jgi:hypothetical protein
MTALGIWNGQAGVTMAFLIRAVVLTAILSFRIHASPQCSVLPFCRHVRRSYRTVELLETERV